MSIVVCLRSVISGYKFEKMLFKDHLIESRYKNTFQFSITLKRSMNINPKKSPSLSG